MKIAILLAIVTTMLVVCFAQEEFDLEKLEWDKVKDGAAFKCHKKGFNQAGIDDDMKMSYKRCVEKKIKSRNCLVSCIVQEYGIVKDNKWQEDKAQSALDKVWDKTQPNQELLRESLWKDTKKCLDDFEKSGGKYPTDYTTDCKEIVPLEVCAMKARKCPKV